MQPHGRECLPGSEPREVWMVRRRSTVRFCKRAPGHVALSIMLSIRMLSKSATRVALAAFRLKLFFEVGERRSVSGSGKRYQVARISPPPISLLARRPPMSQPARPPRQDDSRRQGLCRPVLAYRVLPRGGWPPARDEDRSHAPRVGQSSCQCAARHASTGIATA